MALALSTALIGCKSDEVTQPAEIFELALQGGDEQSGPGGSVLSEPLQVLVKDPTGNPVRGITVTFTPAGQTGVQLSDSRVTSGLDGVARVDARLGTTLGDDIVIAHATLPGNSSEEVTFRASVTPPPTITSITPTTVRAGDTVTITGTNFNQSLVGNAVLFGLSRALVIDGSETSLRVVAPPCVAAGTVAVRVQVGSASTNMLSVTYQASSSTIALQPLEGITISGAEIETCLSLVGSGASYLVIPQFATATLELQSYPYLLGNRSATGATSTAVASPTSSQANVTQGQFDRRLRELDHTLTAAARAYAASRPAGVSLGALAEGSTRSFRVLSKLPDSATPSPEFKTATARLEYVGDNVLLYVDQRRPSGDAGYTAQELRRFGDMFDNDLYEIGVRTFGTESDIDNNDRIIVLLTPIVNGLTAAPCTQGFVTGFFFGYDLTNGSNSNRGEVFYSLVPDQVGSESCAHTKAQVSRIIPGTFIHEFQHMISYNQHVLVRGGSDETLWLNEGLSHIAEEMGARFYENRHPAPPGQLFGSDTAQNLIIGNLFNSYDWLRSPSATSVANQEGYGTLEERGAAWLFLRWLGDQRDSTIYGRLVQTRKTSVENIEEQTGESFASLFGDFGIAIWTDSIVGVPRTDVPQRYRFRSRNLRHLYDALYRATQTTSSPLPQPFPLTLQTLPADGSVTRTLLPGSMDFFQLQTPGTSPNIGLQFSKPPTQCGGAASCLFSADFKAQVSVFRLPNP